jgi:hypothetical protein
MVVGMNLIRAASWSRRVLSKRARGARMGAIATKERIHQLVDAMPDGPETEAWLEAIESDLAPNGDEPGTISPERKAALAKLASYFEHPETAPWDWEELREGKLRAWPVR